MGAWQETWLALPIFKSLKPAQQKARVSRTETSMPGLVAWPCRAQSCAMLSQLFSTNRASVSILYLYPSCFKRPGLCQPHGKNRKKDRENNPTHSHCSILKMPKQEFCLIEFRTSFRKTRIKAVVSVAARHAESFFKYASTSKAF